MKDPGYIVETKQGKRGRTYHRKGLIRGKIPVYLDGQETPILCREENLYILGFVD